MDNDFFFPKDFVSCEMLTAKKRKLILMMQYAALKVVTVVFVTSSVLWDLKRVVSLTMCFNQISRKILIYL